ncbi:hypothetical protein [Massilia alkalitolerans]|uniref:hypothetical protein n=1 Tax=Massilia alkalitolerans TaxID=286638 RepID=UPI0028A86BF5|nr:hypothetical protein [Massilia alkalitolerans]
MRMTDVMTTSLCRKWWVPGILGFLSAVLTMPLLRTAGMGSPESWAQWVVYFLCFFTIWRCLGFLGWLAVLLIVPKSKLLDPVKR